MPQHANGRLLFQALLTFHRLVESYPSYKNGQLSVEWQLPKQSVVSDVALYADGKSISCNTRSAISVTLDSYPRIITLRMNINGNHAETSAWVINYDALDQKVSRTQ